jgi:hypothetical protein
MTAQAEDTVVSWRGGFGSRVPAQLKAVSSVAAAAKRTYTEGNQPLQLIRWIAPQNAAQAIRAVSKHGVIAPAGTVAPPEPHTPVKEAA